MKSFVKVFLRELRRIKRFKQIWIMLTAVPVFLCGIIIWTFEEQTPKNLPICIIDYDHSAYSRELIRMFDAPHSLNVKYQLTSEIDAKHKILSGKAYAVISIPENFQIDVIKGNSPIIAFKYNNQYLLTGGTIYKEIMTVFGTYTAKLSAKQMIKSGIPARKARITVNQVTINEHIKSNPFINYAYFLTLSSFAHLLQLLATFTAVWALGSEFRRGSGKRWLKLSGGSVFTAVFAKFAPYNIAFCLVYTIMFLIYEIIYNAPLNGNILFLFLTLPLYIAAYQSMGLMFVTITNNLRLSLSCAAFYTSLGFTFAGVTYPFFAMPKIAQIYAQLLPIKHWLKIALGQTLIGTPVRCDLNECVFLLLFCLIPMLFYDRLKFCICNKESWYKL